MKKTTLTSLAIALCLSATTIAQTQRTILYEEWTGETCPNCPPANQYLYPIVHAPGNYPNKIVKVSYPVPIPDATGLGSNSQYIQDSAEINKEMYYYFSPYGIPEAPYTRFNGIELPDALGNAYPGAPYELSQTMINDSAIVNSPFALSITHTINPTADSITINAKITAAQVYNQTAGYALKFYMALEEAVITYTTAPGSNGEKVFYDVMRKMVPSLQGTVLNNTWTNGQIQNLTFKIAIPSYIFDKSQIAFAGWIQNDAPYFCDTVSVSSSGIGAPYDTAYARRIHQAAYSSPVPLNLDAAALVGNATIQCTTTLTPVAIVKNAGATTLTSCTINYKIDAGTVQTYSWTGNLTTNQTATVSLTPTVTTSGSHAVYISVNSPNSGTDQNLNNNSQTINVIIEPTATPAPIVQGFTTTTFPPANWVLSNAAGGPSQWKRSGTYGGYGTSTNSALYPFYSYATYPDVDDMYMQTIDLTSVTSPQLRFDYAYNYYYDSNYGEIDDSLAVSISTDCGATWHQLFYKGGQGLTTALTPGDSNEYTPASTEWKTSYISLSAYASSTEALIKFSAINNNGNDLYVDNINISTTVVIKQNQGNISNVKVYPNPANNQFNVNVNLSSSEKTNISLYNIMGQVVLTKNYDFNVGDNLVNIPVDQLANGIYTVLVSSTSGSYQTKVSVIK